MSAPEIINPPGGGGGGTVTGTGTPGKLAKFTGTGTSIGDSAISESGILISINAGVGTNMVINDGTGMAGPSYDGVRLCRGSEALFSSSDSVRTFRAGVTGATVVAGSTTSHDLLLQRGNVTALTLGASGAVAFAGNLTSSAAQTWTLAAGSTSALNIQSGLLNLDTANSRVGIGTASPLWKNHTVGVGALFSGSAYNLAAVSQDQSTYRGISFGYDSSGQIGTIAATTGGAGSSLAFWTFSGAVWGERMRIDSAGNVGIGTASATTSAATGSLVIGQNNVSQQWAARIYGGNDANRAPVLSLFRAGNTEGIIAEIKNGAVGALALGITGGVANFNDATLAAACQVQITSTLMDISGTNYGLKLPAAPGNTDTQTLDCYQEGSVSSTSFTTGITTTSGAITTSILWTRIGRSVKIDITIAPAAGQSLTLANPWYVVGTGVPSVSVSSPVMSICTSLGAVRSSGYVYNSGVTPVFYAFSLGILAADEKVFISVTTQS